jgi:Raf kinase inhibitor-like YbhB/YbcL family protein
MSLPSLRILLGLAALSLTLVACGPGNRRGDDDDDDDDDDSASDDDDDVSLEFSMWSPDFIDDGNINHNFDCEQALPVEFACDGSNPEIDWEGAPEGAVAFSLIFDDPTAGNFPHWAIFNIPGSWELLEAGISGNGVVNNPPGGAIELTNGFGWPGYLGSCPGGINHYRWRLWALSETLPLDGNANFGTLAAASEALSLDSVTMCHVFNGADVPVGR